jgi:hypothetical protein
VTGSENLHAACNALIVASQLGSDRAANFLLQHMDALNQPRWQLRLRAASACATLLAGGSLDARRTQQAADRLREAARQEDNPFVLRHHFIAIDHADRTGLDPAERLALRATLLEAIVAVVDRLAANNINEPEPMIASVTSGLLLARQKYITVMDSNEKRAAGQRLGPAIGKMLTLISNQWEIAQADPTLKRSYAAIIQAGEGFLGFIDPLVRGGAAPQTALVNAWNAGNKSRFDEDLAKWQNLLQQPSYAKR